MAALTAQDFLTRPIVDRSQPLAESGTAPESGTALQIAALSRVFEKQQDEQMGGLKRKLLETTLALERAAMEREDFRAGNGPGFLTSPGQVETVSWRRCRRGLQAEALELQDDKDNILDGVAHARNCLDNYFNDKRTEHLSDARGTLNNMLGMYYNREPSDSE